jgi:hypothetical protein
LAHDQLFKELLRAFLREFIELFFPHIAARLDLSQISFPDKELFTDVPEGSVRRADTVAQVPSLDGEPELVLIHVETQSERRNEVRFRMFEYYALLRLRFKLPVFPIVLYIVPGTGSNTRETYVESLFGEEILNFQYVVVGLPEMQADDYLESDNPLAPALSALMQPAQVGRAMQKIVSLRRTANSGVDDARRLLLANLIETYLRLNVEEETEFQRVISEASEQEVREMLSIYEERGIVKGMRNAVLRLLREKFGELPEQVETRVRSITDEAELDTLLGRVLSANSLAEMGLEEAASNGSQA